MAMWETTHAGGYGAAAELDPVLKGFDRGFGGVD